MLPSLLRVSPLDCCNRSIVHLPSWAGPSCKYTLQVYCHHTADTWLTETDGVWPSWRGKKISEGVDFSKKYLIYSCLLYVFVHMVASDTADASKYRSLHCLCMYLIFCKKKLLLNLEPYMPQSIDVELERGSEMCSDTSPLKPLFSWWSTAAWSSQWVAVSTAVQWWLVPQCRLAIVIKQQEYGEIQLSSMHGWYS